MFACLGVTYRLLFWQNDWVLLRATAVTRGWKGHRIRVGTQRELRRKTFFRRSCRDSNSQPFDYESSALTNKLSHTHTHTYARTHTTHHTTRPPLTPAPLPPTFSLQYPAGDDFFHLITVHCIERSHRRASCSACSRLLAQDIDWKKMKFKSDNVASLECGRDV